MTEPAIPQPIIKVDNLVKQFGSFTALNGVSLDVH